MTIEVPKPHPTDPVEAVSEPIPARAPLSESELIACVQGIGGWVAPGGLAPRAVFDRLAEKGLLEAWPNRPLYRAPASTDEGEAV